jgi:hypothetical protein
MNIFYLDHSPVLAAQYHCDKHVVKMILESVQIISTVASFYNIEAPYKPTHVNHPCVIWAGESYSNLEWLWDLTVQLNTEYLIRFSNRHHKSILAAVEYDLVNKLIKVMPRTGFTYPPQCMPEEYRQKDIVQAYRDYYSFGKKHLHKWTKREEPFWLVKI